MIRLALAQLNKPYVHGGHGPDNFDCAGLIWYLYNELLGINIYENGYGESTTTQIMTNSYGNISTYDEDNRDKNIDLLTIGDILFFHRQSLKDNIPKKDNKYPGHCGLYLGENNFIHCTIKTGCVSINNLYKDIYWYQKLVGFQSIINDGNIILKKEMR